MGRESFPEWDTLFFHSFFNFDLFRFKTESNITVRIYICFNTDRKKRENHILNLQTIHTTSIGFYFSFPIKTEISFIGFVSLFKFFFNLTQKLKALHFYIIHMGKWDLLLCDEWWAFQSGFSFENQKKIIIVVAAATSARAYDLYLQFNPCKYSADF